MAQLFHRNFKHRVKDILHLNLTDLSNHHHGNTVTTATDEKLNSSLLISQVDIFATESTTNEAAMLNSFVTGTTRMHNNVIGSLNVSNNSIGLEHHEIMVAVLMAIFMCISLSIAVSIFVFCRKKNSVFMLQKCEQDSDFEMNDINTEANTSDSDTDTFDSEYEMIGCSDDVAPGNGRICKSVSSLQQFLSPEKTTVRLSLSHSFPNISHYVADASKPISTPKDNKETKRKCYTTHQRRKMNQSHYEKPNGTNNPKVNELYESCSVPLLKSHPQTGFHKGSRNIYTGKKLTTHSLSMPMIMENQSTNKKQISHQLTNETADPDHTFNESIFSNIHNSKFSNIQTSSCKEKQNVKLATHFSSNPSNDKETWSKNKTWCDNSDLHSDHLNCLVEVTNPNNQNMDTDNDNGQLFDV